MRSAKINFHFSLFCLLFIATLCGFLWEALLFFLVICLHEFGHIVGIVLFKGQIKVLHLSAIGGMIEIKQQNLRFYQEFIINSGGLIVNFLIFFLCKLTDVPFENTIIQYNKLMIIFNILPIYPLDGYRLLKQILGLFYEDEYLADVLFYFSLLGVLALFILAYIAKSIGLFLVVAFLGWKCFELRKLNALVTIKHYLGFQRLIRE